MSDPVKTIIALVVFVFLGCWCIYNIIRKQLEKRRAKKDQMKNAMKTATQYHSATDDTSADSTEET